MLAVGVGAVPSAVVVALVAAIAAPVHAEAPEVGAAYEGPNTLVEAAGLRCAASGTLRLSVEVLPRGQARLSMGAPPVPGRPPAQAVNVLALGPDGTFSQTESPAGGTATGAGRLDRDGGFWESDFRRGEMRCRQRFELRRVGAPSSPQPAR
jgi:hypothetical protein